MRVCLAFGTAATMVEDAPFELNQTILNVDDAIEKILVSQPQRGRSIPCSQFMEVTGLVNYRYVADGLDAPGPRHVSQIAGRVTQVGTIPIDQRHWKAVGEDRVVRTWIAVHDALPLSKDCRSFEQIINDLDAMELSEHLTPTPISARLTLGGVIGCRAWDVGEGVPPLVVDAKEPRRMRKADGFEATKKTVDPF